MATPMPITEKQFADNAKDLVLTGKLPDGSPVEFVLKAKCIVGKSLGWTSGSLRFSWNIGGVKTPIIGSFNLTVIGSKHRG